MPGVVRQIGGAAGQQDMGAVGPVGDENQDGGGAQGDRAGRRRGREGRPLAELVHPGRRRTVLARLRRRLADGDGVRAGGIPPEPPGAHAKKREAAASVGGLDEPGLLTEAGMAEQRPCGPLYLVGIVGVGALARVVGHRDQRLARADQWATGPPKERSVSLIEGASTRLAPVSVRACTAWGFSRSRQMAITRCQPSAVT